MPRLQVRLKPDPTTGRCYAETKSTVGRRCAGSIARVRRRGNPAGGDQPLARCVYATRQSVRRSRDTPATCTTRVDPAGSGLAVVSARSNGVRTRLNVAKAQLNAVSRRLHAVGARLYGVRAHVNAVRTPLHGVRTRLNTVSAQLNTVTPRLHAVGRRLYDVKPQLSTVRTQTNDVRVRVHGVRKALRRRHHRTTQAAEIVRFCDFCGFRGGRHGSGATHISRKVW